MASDLSQQIHSLLEPRILLAEDTYARAMSISRRSLKIWRAIDVVEKKRGSDSPQLITIKESLEVALREDDEEALGEVENDLRVLLENEGVHAGLGDEGNEATGLRAAAPSSSSSSSENIILQNEGKKPFLVKLFGVTVDGEEEENKIPAYKKALYVSACAWVCAIIGCIVAIVLLTRTYIIANKNKRLYQDRQQVRSLEVPELIFCNPDDNVPAFFDAIPGRNALGSPFFAIKRFRNVERNTIEDYPKTRQSFEEVYIAEGNEQQKRDCERRLKQLDASFIEQRDRRSSDFPTCRSCLRLRSNVSVVQNNPAFRNDGIADTGLIFQLTTSRLYSICTRKEYKESIDGTLDAAVATIARNVETLQNENIINFGKLDPVNYKDEEAVSTFFQKLNIETVPDPTQAKYFTFLCNVLFFSGHFYPTPGNEKQQWKFENGTFKHVGGPKPYEVNLDMIRGSAPSTPAPKPSPARWVYELIGLSEKEIAAKMPPPGSEGSPGGGGPGAVGGNPGGPSGGSPGGPPGGSPEEVPGGPPGGGGGGGPPGGIGQGGPGEAPGAVPENLPPVEGGGDGPGGGQSAEFMPDELYDFPPYQTEDPPIPDNKDMASPLLPIITIYSRANARSGTDDKFVSFASEDILGRVTATRSQSLQVSTENDPTNGTIRPANSRSFAVEDFKWPPFRNRVGFFSYAFELSYDEFFTQTLTFRSTYPPSQYIADMLNMFGIFLGISIFSILMIPATKYLIRRHAGGG